jgi:hypothetical protein
MKIMQKKEYFQLWKVCIRLPKITSINISKIIQSCIFYSKIAKINKKHSYFHKHKIYYFYSKFQYYINKDLDNFKDQSVNRVFLKVNKVVWIIL